MLASFCWSLCYGFKKSVLISIKHTLMYLETKGHQFCHMLLGGRGHSVSIEWREFSSIVQSCPTLWNPMDCSTSGLPDHHQLLESTQTHVHQVSDAIQTFHPLSSPSPPTFNLSQYPGLFQWVGSSHQVAKVLGVSVVSLSLLQGIFPTQESNWSLLHCRQILYRLSHQGSL